MELEMQAAQEELEARKAEAEQAVRSTRKWVDLWLAKSLSANGSAAFKWKMLCHWLKGPLQ